MENSSLCKVSALISVVALIVAGASYFCPNKTTEPASDADEKMKSMVINIIRDNPQLIMDAMGEGMAKKREESLKVLADEVANSKDELGKMALTFGDMASKVSIIAFVDPLCKHCMDFQKDLIKIVNSKKGICFRILPVAVLGEDSVTLSNVYYAVYEKNAEKALAFIDYVVNSKDPLDKAGIEKGLKSVGMSTSDIEAILPDCDKKVIANGKKAEALRVPVVPAVFAVVGNKAEMLQNPDVDSIVKLLDAGGVAEEQKNNK